MRRSHGFTLLEILVALSLFAVVGGTLLQLFHDGLKTARIANENTYAVLLARSKLTELQAYESPAPGIDEGSFGDGYRWRTVLSETADSAAANTTPLAKLDLTLQVVWGEEGDERSITVDSILLSRRITR
ncbi:MAG: prepilin-type N-terminal cleavage/methylation domain-containing protein [Gammaproteobacteria bacterium]|nr:prepilin-type N-terminal cleavage/methylation domain-containing protein [Gammaproteobacteria bacterium]